jgi:hypothetical protein
MNKNYFFIILFFLSIVLVGCTSNKVVISDSSDKVFSVVSTESFNESMCSSTGYGVAQNGFDWGIRVILKDKDTNEILKGYAIYTSNIGGGGVSVDTTYTCEENIDNNIQIINVYAAGYSPITFSISSSNSSLMTLEVLMIKSCTGAPSCFDNFEVQNSALKNSNRTLYDKSLNDFQNSFYYYIDKNLGVNRTDYTLYCMECDMSRGGYVKAKGKYRDGSDLELYYHWGWCSSGGTDCGYSVCISTTSESIFNNEKTSYCNTLSWNGRNDNFCTSEAFNNDTIIRNDCLNGKLENQNSGRWTLAFGQGLNRCSSSITNLNFDCMGN